MAFRSGSELKKWRLDRHPTMSMARAARCLGVSSATYSRWEKATDELPEYVALACAAITAGIFPEPKLGRILKERDQ